MSNPNSFNNNSENTNEDNPWVQFAEEMAEKESPNLRESERLKQEASHILEQFKETKKEYGGKVPDDIWNASLEKYEQIRKAIKEAQITETQALIPESKREAFREYADDDSSIFTIDCVIDGIYRYSQGENLENIKEDILTQDWNGANEEINRKRGMVAYDEMVGFLGIDK